jgi:hypothetical protein
MMCAPSIATNLRPDLVSTQHYRFDDKSVDIDYPLAPHFASRAARSSRAMLGPGRTDLFPTLWSGSGLG